MVLERMWVEFHCCRCRHHFKAQMDMSRDENGAAVIYPGTLDNDWALRWAASHARPNASL